MRKRWLTLLLLSIFLLCCSLLYKTGYSSCDPMAYRCGNRRIVNGVCPIGGCTFSYSGPNAKRGFPLGMVITGPGDSHDEIYRGILVRGVIADFALAFGLSYLIVYLVTNKKSLAKPNKKTG